MDIGEYRVDMRASLGSGAYGIVYKGSQKKDGSPVAIKKIDIAEHLKKVHCKKYRISCQSSIII